MSQLFDPSIVSYGMVWEVFDSVSQINNILKLYSRIKHVEFSLSDIIDGEINYEKPDFQSITRKLEIHSH